MRSIESKKVKSNGKNCRLGYDIVRAKSRLLRFKISDIHYFLEEILTEFQAAKYRRKGSCR